MQDQDGEHTLSGASSAPTGDTSQTGGKPTSIDVEALLAALDDPRVAETLGRKLQATKDRRFADQEKKNTEFADRLARFETLVQGGLKKDQAIQWMDWEDRMNQTTDARGAQPKPSQPVVGSQGQKAGFDMDAFLKSVGIDPNDSEVPTLFNQGVLDEQKLGDLIRRKVASTPVAKASQVMPAGSGSAQTPMTSDEIANRILELSSEPSGHWEELKLLREQLKKSK